MKPKPLANARPCVPRASDTTLRKSVRGELPLRDPAADDLLVDLQQLGHFRHRHVNRPSIHSSNLGEIISIHSAVPPPEER